VSSLNIAEKTGLPPVGQPAAVKDSGSQKRRRVRADSHEINLRALQRWSKYRQGRLQERTRYVLSVRPASNIGKVESLARLKLKLKGICAVFAKGATALSLRRQLIACRRITGVQLVRGEQSVALRADVSYLQKNVAGQLPLDGQIVLVGILGPHIRRELSEINTPQKPRPI